MRGQRTHRLLFVALTLLLAGFLAIPAKLSPPPDRTRIAVGVGPSTWSPPPRPAPALVSLPPPAPRLEHAIQEQPPAELTGTATASVVGPIDQTVRDRIPVVRAPTTEAASHVYGLIIGINDYPGTSSDLRGAVFDAEDMSDVLALNGVPEANVRTLLDGDASATGVTEGLQWLASTARADSTVVLFYAGHVRKLGEQTEAVVTSDHGVLPDWYLAKQLEGLQAHNVWIVMAACYGGGFTELMAPGRMLTAAADANSLAYENESFHRSYLDEYLIHQGLLLGGAALPTAQNAFDFAQAGLERDYPDRTLTQFDQSTEAISLDGVDRPAPAPAGPPDTPPDNGGMPLVPPSSPPPGPPPAPAPCRNPLGLLCPPGSC